MEPERGPGGAPLPDLTGAGCGGVQGVQGVQACGSARRTTPGHPVMVARYGAKETRTAAFLAWNPAMEAPRGQSRSFSRKRLRIATKAQDDCKGLLWGHCQD